VIGGRTASDRDPDALNGAAVSLIGLGVVTALTIDLQALRHGGD
jgi:hypothetical protein